MKIVEFKQTSYDGGWPVENGNGFEHGELIYVVSKSDLDEMLRTIRATCQWAVMNSDVSGVFSDIVNKIDALYKSVK